MKEIGAKMNSGGSLERDRIINRIEGALNHVARSTTDEGFKRVVLCVLAEMETDFGVSSHIPYTTSHQLECVKPYK
jgi:hypothetical protein